MTWLEESCSSLFVNTAYAVALFAVTYVPVVTESDNDWSDSSIKHKAQQQHSISIHSMCLQKLINTKEKKA